MTDRPRPPRPRTRKGKVPRTQRRDQFKTLPGPVGDLLEEDLWVLEWVTRHVGSMGYPPSIRELKEAFGLSSTKLAFDVLRRLEAYGFLDVDPGVTRGIRLVNLPDVKDQGAARLRLWLSEAAQLVRQSVPDAEDDSVAGPWLRKVQTALW